MKASCNVLVEIMSEEIPARMHKGALEQIDTLVRSLCDQRGIFIHELTPFVSMRRIAFLMSVNPRVQRGGEVKRGPKIAAPSQALDGFLRSVGCIQNDLTQKEGYWYAVTPHEDSCVDTFLEGFLKEFLQRFEWPKSMCWHNTRTNRRTKPWVRPIRSIVCMVDEKACIFDIDEMDVVTSSITYGNRYLSKNSITINHASLYRDLLREAFVIVDYQERFDLIHTLLEEEALSRGITLCADQELLEELSGLIEYPFVHIGAIDEKYIGFCDKVLSTSMRIHQKYTSFERDGRLAPFFGVICTQHPTSDMVRGFDRVLRARLEDALFFYTQDHLQPLELSLEGLDRIVFHEKLSSLGAKVRRLMSLCDVIQGGDDLKRCLHIMKGDLVSLMVREFPELQGIMGSFYAKDQGEKDIVCAAIAEHYKPQGPKDTIPKTQVAQQAALYDKCDTLLGFFGVGIEPTGSKDPYALRRSALGIIRLFVEGTCNQISLRTLLTHISDIYAKDGIFLEKESIQRTETFILDRFSIYLKGHAFEAPFVDGVLRVAYEKGLVNLKTFYNRVVFMQTGLPKEDLDLLLKTYRRVRGLLAGAQDLLSEEDLSQYSLQEGEDTLLKEWRAFKNLSDSCSDIERFSFMRSICESIEVFCDTNMILCDDFSKKKERLSLLNLFLTEVKSFFMENH